MARGVTVLEAQSAYLPDVALRFNKRSATPGCGHANVCYEPGGRVEGVLYRFGADDDFRKLDRFEQTPVNYSREILPLVADGVSHRAWVYIGNRAVLAEGLKPERWYMKHLLAGAGFLSDAYLQFLLAFDCIEHDPQDRPLHL